MVGSLFALAREKKPSVIFLDEIDALLCKRSSDNMSGGSYSHNHLVSAFLDNMDGLSKNSSGILVLGATNVCFDLYLFIYLFFLFLFSFD